MKSSRSSSSEPHTPASSTSLCVSRTGIRSTSGREYDVTGHQLHVGSYSYTLTGPGGDPLFRADPLSPPSHGSQEAPPRCLPPSRARSQWPYPVIQRRHQRIHGTRETAHEPIQVNVEQCPHLSFPWAGEMSVAVTAPRITPGETTIRQHSGRPQLLTNFS